MNEPTSSAPRSFPSPDVLHQLSARLMAGEDVDVTDDEIVSVLGPRPLDAFRFVQERLSGRARRTTREPAFCHSADVALRALDLGYPGRVLEVCLLHDVVEDPSRNMVELAENLDDIGARFGQEVLHWTRLLTNRYDFLLAELEGRLNGHLPFDHQGLAAVREALQQLPASLPTAVASRFACELEWLTGHFLDQVDVSDGARKARTNRGHRLLGELQLQSYRLFIQEICDDANRRLNPRDALDAELGLVVKAFDIVDNLRTTEVSSFGTLEKILKKCEFFLDTSFFLHDAIRARGAHDSTFIELYDFVKHHLLEQLVERRAALAHLADSRFSILLRFLMQEISRLQGKYRVGDEPAADLERLRVSLREQNRRHHPVSLVPPPHVD